MADTLANAFAAATINDSAPALKQVRRSSLCVGLATLRTLHDRTYAVGLPRLEPANSHAAPIPALLGAGAASAADGAAPAAELSRLGRALAVERLVERLCRLRGIGTPSAATAAVLCAPVVYAVADGRTRATSERIGHRDVGAIGSAADVDGRRTAAAAAADADGLPVTGLRTACRDALVRAGDGL